MSGINISSFFVNSSNSTSSFGSVNLGDYALIRSGAYKRLMRSYFDESDKKTGSSSNSSNQVTSKELVPVTQMKSSADSTKDAVAALADSKLYEKKTTTTKDETGKEITTTDYDKDAIKKAVKNFVSSYNSLMDDAEDVDNSSIERKTDNLKNMTKANRSVLKDMGISVGYDNRLTLDEDALKNANISTIESMFASYGSYGSAVRSSVSQMSNSLNSLLAKSSGSAYTYTGAYASYQVPSVYDTVVKEYN